MQAQLTAIRQRQRLPSVPMGLPVDGQGLTQALHVQQVTPALDFNFAPAEFCVGIHARR